MVNKKYVLIDSENLCSGEYTGIDKLSKHDTIVLFNSIFSEGSINWKLLYKIQQKPKNEQPNLIHFNVERKANANEKDKMDYYMIAHITQLLSKNNTLGGKFKNLFQKSETEYCIISKDKGFDRYIEYFKDIYSATVRRFNNFNDLHNYYNKNASKKTASSNNNSTSSSDKNTDSSITTTTLSKEVKTLTKLIKELNEKVENKILDDSQSNALLRDDFLSLANYLNDKILDTSITGKQENNNLDLDENIDLTLNNDNSNIVYLSEFKEHKEDCYDDSKDIESSTPKVDDSFPTLKQNKEFKKLNLVKFEENYNAYPKKKKLLRDETFIKNIFAKHNLYNKYNKKSLDKFAEDCDKGLINIKTMTIRLESSFSPSSIKDFRPALNEIIKYQIKNDIM